VQGEYDALSKKVKESLSADEQKRLSELEALKGSRQVTQELVKEYDALIAKGKAKLSEADAKRLQELDDVQKQVVEAINTCGEKLGGEIQAEQRRISELLQNTVNAAIADQGKKQKLAVILNRNVDTQDGTVQMVLWGGVDITEAVTKALNDAFTTDLFKPKK